MAIWAARDPVSRIRTLREIERIHIPPTYGEGEGDWVRNTECPYQAEMRVCGCLRAGRHPTRTFNSIHSRPFRTSVFAPPIRELDALFPMRVDRIRKTGYSSLEVSHCARPIESHCSAPVVNQYHLGTESDS